MADLRPRTASTVPSALVAPTTWIYFKLYVGSAVDKLDPLILDLAPRVLALSPRQPWFFLRYLDDGGAHLRLRLRAQEEDAAAVREGLARVCRESLARLPQLPTSEYRPMVTSSPFDPTRLPAGATVRLEPCAYEPELDTFGGETGITIAEGLFAESSRLAVAVLGDEAAGRYSRKTLAPCFMARIASAFYAAGEVGGFWDRYSTYWLGGSTPEARRWRATFGKKADALVASGTDIVIVAEALPLEAGQRLREWGEAVDRAAAGYASLGGGAPVRDVLVLHFTHLMNNRLGLLPIEEAYLAALLQRRAEGSGA
jgi:thiopeptide-type bacteriocin biosynthesis protein